MDRRRRCHSGELQNKGKNKGAQHFSRMAARPNKRPQPRESPEKAPLAHQDKKPTSQPLEAERPSIVDTNKLHHIFDKKGRELDEFLSHYNSEEDALNAIENATRKLIMEQKITGQYKLRVDIDVSVLPVRTVYRIG